MEKLHIYIYFLLQKLFLLLVKESMIIKNYLFPRYSFEQEGLRNSFKLQMFFNQYAIIHNFLARLTQEENGELMKNFVPFLVFLQKNNVRIIMALTENCPGDV